MTSIMQSLNLPHVSVYLCSHYYQINCKIGIIVLLKRVALLQKLTSKRPSDKTTKPYLQYFKLTISSTYNKNERKSVLCLIVF